MPISKAAVATPSSARYLTQLCKHFAHRVPVTFDAERGRIEFAGGVCRLAARSDHLLLEIEAAQASALSEVEGVVARHLERFAFREKSAIEWTRELY
jgi:uncharacterized protein